MIFFTPGYKQVVFEHTTEQIIMIIEISKNWLVLKHWASSFLELFFSLNKQNLIVRKPISGLLLSNVWFSF